MLLIVFRSLLKFSILSFISLNILGTVVLETVSENMWYLYIHYICRRLVSVSLGSVSVIHYFPWFSFFLFLSFILVFLAMLIECWPLYMKNSRNNMSPRIVLCFSRYDLHLLLIVPDHFNLVRD